jgi:hypothetical protein
VCGISGDRGLVLLFEDGEVDINAEGPVNRADVRSVTVRRDLRAVEDAEAQIIDECLRV